MSWAWWSRILIFNDGIDYGYRAQLEAAYGARLRPMDAWTTAPEAEMVNRIDHEGLLMLMFTSGTTGRSKGVMLSEKNYFTACQMYIDGLKSVLDHEERLVPQYLDQTFSHFTLVPMFHLAGFICYFVYGIQGWTLNLCCDARDLRRDMSLMHSDAMSTPPVLVEMICNEVKRGHADRLNGLWNLSCSSAILDPAILSDLVKNGFYINQCYSMTELAGYGLLNVTQEGDHLRALGKPDGFCEVKVDETGEICVRGGCVMLGYYKDPEATAEVIDKDGWFHTGDLARVDEEGYYYMTGRKKNLIILDSGENVSPEELEKLLGPAMPSRSASSRRWARRSAPWSAVRMTAAAGEGFCHRGEPHPALYKRISVVEFSAEPCPATRWASCCASKIKREKKEQTMVNNVYDLVTRTMEQEFPGRVAFRWVEDATGTVKEKTYAEYAQDIRRAAAWFARNIPEVEGKRVVLLSRNCYEYGVNTFGAVLAGAVLVTMNQKKTWDELSWELELAEPALILNDGVDYGCRDQLEAAYGERLRPMDVWKDTAPGGLEKKIDPNALMVMLFTSGTTGRSKAVMLAERNFFTVMQMHVAMGDHLLDFKHRQLPEDKNDALSNFAILPLFHLGTFICLFSWPFKGWALNLCSDLRNFYRDLGLMHSDSIAVAPVLMESIYKDVKRGRADKLNGLWNPCGSSAMFDSEMLLGLVENGMYITQCYGMTETCGDGLVNYAQAEPHIRALGKPDGHCEYKLDETGEICIRGGCVMLGYYKDPEATAEIIDKDGWLHTGDLAREDEDGYYYMVGRKKNLIILGTGENVSPEELERKLNACPEVQECVVKEMGKRSAR